ncbi:MAG: DUF5615 family PIN-like protein [Thermoleophilia bacterium]
MKLLADEGVDAAIVARLRAEGHDVVYVAELSPSINDKAVLDLANGDERVLVIADKDFGELVFRLRQVAFGVLLVRLPGLSSAGKADAVSELVREHGPEMAGAFTVVSRGWCGSDRLCSQTHRTGASTSAHHCWVESAYQRVPIPRECSRRFAPSRHVPRREEARMIRRSKKLRAAILITASVIALVGCRLDGGSTAGPG